MAHNLSRKVSVIGTSSMPQMSYDDPELAGLSIYDIWTCACHQAMDDAGITPKDVDKISYAHFAYFPTCGHIAAPVGSLEEWIGCSGKPIAHLEQACATGYMAFVEGVNAIASGMYDVVLVAGVENPKHFISSSEPAFRVHPLSEYTEEWHPGKALFDCTYDKFDGASDQLLTEEQGYWYKKNFGIDEETLDDAYNAMAISLRRGAVRNPRALRIRSSKEYADEAKEAGFDDVMEYMRSDHNPKITQFIRKSGSLLHNLATGCIVLCAADVAENFSGSKHAINVADFASSSSSIRDPYCFHQMNVNVREALDAGGKYDPDNLDLFITTVMTSGEQLDSAEVFGYLPEGEGYKYELEYRTAFDGDKPINPHGGDAQFGHSFGVSGINMISEAILQMRGEAGDCQVKKPIRQCLVRGMGGGHTTVGILLEK